MSMYLFRQAHVITLAVCKQRKTVKQRSGVLQSVCLSVLHDFVPKIVRNCKATVGQQQRHYSVVHGPTPLLHILVAPCHRRRRAPRLDESIMQEGTDEASVIFGWSV